MGVGLGKGIRPGELHLRVPRIQWIRKVVVQDEITQGETISIALEGNVLRSEDKEGAGKTHCKAAASEAGR